MTDTEDRYRSKLARVQVILVIGVLACVFASSHLQPVVDLAWKGLLRSRIFGVSFFETIWTGLCYFEIERRCLAAVTDPSSTLERFDQRSGTKLYKNGTVRYRHAKHRIPELFRFLGPLLLLDLTMIKKYRGVPLDRILRSGNYDPQTIGVGDSLTSLRIRETYLVPSLHQFTLASPLQFQRALPLQAPTPRAIVLTLIGSLIIYDFLFGLAHWALHHLPIVSRWHLTHHSHAEMQPQVTNQLDITERLILILSANWALNLLHAHPLTRILFVPLFLGMLIQNHAGRALHWSYDQFLPEGWAMGPKRHALHHRKGNVYYAPYFTAFDRLLVAVGGITSEGSPGSAAKPA